LKPLLSTDQAEKLQQMRKEQKKQLKQVNTEQKQKQAE